MITVPQNTEFPPLKQIEAGVLNVGYAEVGPAGGKPVVLLHGWPYDIHSFVEVAPLLAAKGYRVVVPYLRGYAAAEGGATVVVPVLLRHRAWPRRVRQVHARLQQARLAARVAEVAVRRRDVRSLGRRL